MRAGMLVKRKIKKMISRYFEKLSMMNPINEMKRKIYKALIR